MVKYFFSRIHWRNKMAKYTLSSIKTHPEYETIIREVVNNNVDEKLMGEALTNSKTESQAEALYVFYRLREISF